MQFRATLLLAATVAGLAAAAPASSKASQASQAGEDAFCGGVVSPFTGFLDYQVCHLYADRLCTQDC